MLINLKNGLEQLVFGMKQKDVIAIFGKPNRQFEDDDANIIYLYNKEKFRLTFYADEEFKLGYIISSNANLEVLGNKLMGLNVNTVKENLPFKNWEVEHFDSITNHFNESNWFILQSEFDEIVKIELGAIINNQDQIDWKFKP